MANGKLLGCWGAVVGLLLAAVLGWMAIELLTMAVSVAGEDGPLALPLSPLFLHELGELLVVGALLTGIYVAVLRPRAYPALAAWTRPACWGGAGLQVAAWWGLGGTGLRWWAAALAALGLLGTPVLRRLADAFSPGAPPGTPPDLRA